MFVDFACRVTATTGDAMEVSSPPQFPDIFPSNWPVPAQKREGFTTPKTGNALCLSSTLPLLGLLQYMATTLKSIL